MLVADSVDFRSTAVDDARAVHLDFFQRRIAPTVTFGSRGGAEADGDIGKLAERRAVLGRLDRVLADRQEREAVVAVRIGLHRARESRIRIAHGHSSASGVVASVRRPTSEPSIGCVRNRCRQCGSERHPHRDLHRASFALLLFRPPPASSHAA